MIRRRDGTDVGRLVVLDTGEIALIVRVRQPWGFVLRRWREHARRWTTTEGWGASRIRGDAEPGVDPRARAAMVDARERTNWP